MPYKDKVKQRAYDREYKRRKREKIKYSKYVYCYDIETSTTDGIDSTGSVIKVAYIISFCCSRLDVETGNIEHFYFGRTYSDLNDCFEQIKNISKDEMTLIYAHNFPYEWSFIKDNCLFFRENQTNMKFMSKHKPLQIQCSNLAFRCSYLLLNKSVKNLGKELTAKTGEDWNKLDYEYNKVRTPFTELTQEEIDYNFKDCDIVLKAIYINLLSRFDIKAIYKYIYTSTGIVRYENKLQNSRQMYNSWIVFNRCSLPTDMRMLQMFRDCFIGGLVTSNPNYIGKILHNVASSDLSSSYPYVMYMYQYPYGFEEKLIMYNYNEFMSFRQSEKYNISKFFLATFTIANVRLKMNYPIWSKHKCHSTLNAEVINGKVIRADELQLSMSSIDFEDFCLFYEFDILSIDKIYVNKYCSKLPKYTINSLERLLIAKQELKVYNNEIDHASELKNDYKFDDTYKYLEKIINECDDLNIQKATMFNEYLRAKSSLNSMYGINVENPIRTEVGYDFETHQYNESPFEFGSMFKGQIKTNLCVGLFITAFARHNLVKMLYILLDNNIDVYYTDTDSLKYDYSNKELCDQLFNLYNRNVRKNDYGIGKMDFEGVYNNFITNGNKSYITSSGTDEHTVIKATISGLPNASQLYTNLFTLCGNNFNELVNKCYGFNIEISPNATRKLTHKYGDVSIDEDMISDMHKYRIFVNVDGYQDYVYNGTILEDCPLTIRGIESSRIQFNNALMLVKHFDAPVSMFERKFIIDEVDNKLKIIDDGYIHPVIREELKRHEI